MVIMKSKYLNAIKKSQKAKRPTVISCKTKIGFGEVCGGILAAHGSPLGEDEISLA